MPATNSHLQLETYFLKELSYSLHDSLDVIPPKAIEAKSISLKISDITTPLDADSQAWRCELTIESSTPKEDEETFYKFRIVMVGFFRVDPTLTSERADILAKTNCPAVLYSTSREIIATVTRRSPFPATLLPLVTFLKIDDSKPGIKEDATSETKSTSKKITARKKSTTKSNRAE